ncbi:hypothetical protein J2Z83_001993 [Virgibacillus natechei]|uniref:Uncharacterized protein n=1 Tax=Virgibacillus natechei TaxID=1216297 RepID=A0ABS4IG34_9BACI|nr:hypothetical protein [Virgibacillus natechei]MBP1969885.1 hypothetical protein [Virgibacillus natechei]UZD12588.1 hypothetical protein OLD84_17070 [Virgibacillus natechei]
MTYGDTWAITSARLCVTPVGSTVSVDLTTSTNISNSGGVTSEPDFEILWEMHLQRNINGSWGTFANRSGYVSQNSPSNRYFSGIAQRNKDLRVVVYFYWGTYENYKGNMLSSLWWY